MADKAVICIACGTNLKTGRPLQRVETRRTEKPKEKPKEKPSFGRILVGIVGLAVIFSWMGDSGSSKKSKGSAEDITVEFSRGFTCGQMDAGVHVQNYGKRNDRRSDIRLMAAEYKPTLGEGMTQTQWNDFVEGYVCGYMSDSR